MKVINDLLNEYHITRDFQHVMNSDYRKNLESTLKSNFDYTPQFKYGGSIAKGTANTNSCDLDLLCYLPSDSNLTLEDIYNETANKLEECHYDIERKNSAIKIVGKTGERKWDTTVDVVPGKYSSNDNNEDVYLWCNKDKARLKTNPKKQIDKVKQSNSKDVIRIIKLFRYFNNFKFKSFYLEVFIIDIVEKDYVMGDSNLDKLVHFCNHIEEIGNTKIYDPANINNNIMKIHTEQEFSIIREKLCILKEVIMTANEEAIRNCIFGESVIIDEVYNSELQNNSKYMQWGNKINPIFRIECTCNNSNYIKTITSFDILQKESDLKFYWNYVFFAKIISFHWIITNAGYEANKSNCLRGETEDTTIDTKANNKVYYRTENTSYYGNHAVQAVIETKFRTYYSNIIIIKVR